MMMVIIIIIIIIIITTTTTTIRQANFQINSKERQFGTKISVTLCRITP